MRTPIQMTDEEIKSFMDFDALLQLRDKAVQEQKSLRKTKKFFISLACLLLIPVMYFAVIDQRQDTPGQVNTAGQGKGEASSVIRGDRGSDSLKVNSEKKDHLTSPAHSKAEAKSGAMPAIATPESPRSDIAPENDSVVPIYVQAEPAQGYPLLYEYFDKNLVYPKDAVADSAGGTLNVVFVIDPTGDAVEIAIENSPGPSFDLEAIRMVENMPLWKPATYNGVPVKSRISLPITFGIRKTTKD